MKSILSNFSKQIQMVIVPITDKHKRKEIFEFYFMLINEVLWLGEKNWLKGFKVLNIFVFCLDSLTQIKREKSSYFFFFFLHLLLKETHVKQICRLPKCEYLS